MASLTVGRENAFFSRGENITEYPKGVADLFSDRRRGLCKKKCLGGQSSRSGEAPLQIDKTRYGKRGQHILDE